MTTKNIIEEDIQLFYRLSCPFSYKDIETAIETAHAIGKDADYLLNLIEEHSEDNQVEFPFIDICAVLYEYILDCAYLEIKLLTNFDIANDGEFRVQPNYMCSRFDYSEESKQLLIEALKNKNVDINKLSLPTQYFLDEVGIN